MTPLFAQEGPLPVELVGGAPIWPQLVITGIAAAATIITVVVSLWTAINARSDRQAEATAREAAEKELREVREQARVEAMMHLHAISVLLVAEWVGEPMTAGLFRDVRCSIDNSSPYPITDVEIYVKYPVTNQGAPLAPMTALAKPKEVLPTDGGSWSERFYIAPKDLAPRPVSMDVPPAAVYFTDKLGNRWRRDSDGSLGLVKPLPVSPSAEVPREYPEEVTSEDPT